MISQRSQTTQASQDRSAHQVWHRPRQRNSSCWDTNEHANARPHEFAIVRDHRLCHARNMLLLRTGGASLALAAARSLMNVTNNHEAASVSFDKFSVLCLFDVCFEVGHGASQVGAVEARPASAPLHLWGLGPAAVFCPWRLGVFSFPPCAVAQWWPSGPRLVFGVSVLQWIGKKKSRNWTLLFFNIFRMIIKKLMTP